MLYASLQAIHVLSIVTWIGGMLFVYLFLRPATAGLEASTRVGLMHGALGRFFSAMTWVSLAALFSGAWMIGRVAKGAVQAGADFVMPLDWKLMSMLGTLMVLLFGHIRFALFGRLKKAALASDWAAGDAALAQIRLWVSINLLLGLSIVLVVYLK